jgi:predicted nucleic acid-binding protein
MAQIPSGDILLSMKIYLDNCSLQRPLDSKTPVRTVLEAETVLGILAMFESGKVELVSSEALLFEIGRNPNLTRQEYALEVLSKAQTFVMLTEEAEKRARQFNVLGIEPLDALHLASAEAAKADYFCTCDDRFLKKAKAISSLRTRMVSPIELIGELEQWQ